MLELMLLRLLLPRAFQVLNWLILTFFLVSMLAIASGLVDHDRNQITYHYQRARETR